MSIRESRLCDDLSPGNSGICPSPGSPCLVCERDKCSYHMGYKYFLISSALFIGTSEDKGRPGAEQTLRMCEDCWRKLEKLSLDKNPVQLNIDDVIRNIRGVLAGEALKDVTDKMK